MHQVAILFQNFISFPALQEGDVYTSHLQRRTEVTTFCMESLKIGLQLKFTIKRNLKIKKDAARAHHFLKYEGPEPSNFFYLA